MNLATFLGGRYKPVPAMRERENINLINDPRDIVESWNARGPKSREHVQVTVLHVEDHDIIARMAKEMLETEGWEVETCADGNTALEKICGHTRYDLLLLDYDLPGVNGLELVSRARALIHRARTPIVVLSATPIGLDARKAGADVFLQKPQDVTTLVKTINRLLGVREQDDKDI
ncbi:MAG TPA: response regulator [Pyrinomonadaceae bacterium]|nr:response regulator [Pyrinomonadaceae bacterium]